MRSASAIGLVFALFGCSDAPVARDTVESDATDATDTLETNDAGDTTDATPIDPIAGPLVRMDFTRTSGFFAAPFPSNELFIAGRDGTTRAAVQDWPTGDVDFVAGLVTLARDQSGASPAGGIFFSLSEAPGASPLPTAATTDGVIRVMPLHSDGTLGPATPVTIHFEADGGPFGAPNLLSALPVQGIPLQPAARYVAVVSRAALGLGRDATLASLLSGDHPAGIDPSYADAVTALANAGEDLDDVAGLAVFPTSDPTRELDRFVTAALAEATPDLTGFTLSETFDRYCVYTKTLDVPDYQRGEPPFSNAGEGMWQTDAQGPVLQRRSPTRLFVTVPRTPAPAAGFPTLVFIRTGGGGDRPLIDRGPRGVAHGDPIVATGTGPAMQISAAGWAGLTWDGPHGGPRNPSHSDEQFLMFNVLNPGATRDNVRQTALEALVMERWLADLTIDTSGCDGASASTHFDASLTTIMGHSMGAWIAPMTLGRGGFDAAIMSGAGGSWIGNIVFKRSPLDVRPLAETLLGYDQINRTLGEHDPVLTLLQWVGDAADPQNYGAAPARDGHDARATHVMMIEGIVDTYILPPIANATALSLALDIAGPELDKDDARLAEFVPLGTLLLFVNRQQRDLPVSANIDGRTRVVLQSAGDAIEDGHEAMFQTAAPKFQYRCFLADLAAHVPPIARVGDDEWAPCDPQ